MPQDQSLKMRGGFLYLDTQSFMAPKVRQKARCHSCGVKGEQLRNQAPNQTCLQRRAGVRARGGCRLANQESDSGNVRCLTRICLALCLAG